MGLFDRFRSSVRPAHPDPILGSWRLIRAEGQLETGEGVELEFKPSGELIYATDTGDRWQIMRLTYRVQNDVLITDQPSAPREERTHFRFEADGTLVLTMVARNAGINEARNVRLRSNKRLKLTARVDCGMNLSSARRSLSAIR